MDQNKNSIAHGNHHTSTFVENVGYKCWFWVGELWELCVRSSGVECAYAAFNLSSASN